MRPPPVNFQPLRRVYSCVKNSLGTLLDPGCRFCTAPAIAELGLCAGCHADLPRIHAHCSRCHAPLARTGLCGTCQRREPPFERAITPYRYDADIADLIRRLKFRGDLAAGRTLGGLLAERLRSEPDRPEVVVPVPLHGRRLRERGFNQSTEIARRLDGVLRTDLLRRDRLTRAQHELDAAERRRNLRGAFAVYGTAPASVLLIDDVYTTGTTVVEATRTLRRSGVKRVWVGTVARVPATR